MLLLLPGLPLSSYPTTFSVLLLDLGVSQSSRFLYCHSAVIWDGKVYYLNHVSFLVNDCIDDILIVAFRGAIVPPAPQCKYAPIRITFSSYAPPSNSPHGEVKSSVEVLKVWILLDTGFVGSAC